LYIHTKHKVSCRTPLPRDLSRGCAAHCHLPKSTLPRIPRNGGCLPGVRNKRQVITPLWLAARLGGWLKPYSSSPLRWARECFGRQRRPRLCHLPIDNLVYQRVKSAPRPIPPASISAIPTERAPLSNVPTSPFLPCLLDGLLTRALHSTWPVRFCTRPRFVVGL
jgi:hypothetical protein